MDSPMYSTSSQSSSLSRPRTKAAMKGYENLKVSIPTSGLDLHQALDRSPNANGCKLAALADIALSSDIPMAFNRSRYLEIDKSHSPKTTESSSIAATQSDVSSIDTEPKNDSGPTVKGKKRSLNSTGNKLGFKERKKKMKATPKSKAKSLEETSTAIDKKISNLIASTTKDVYDFEESHDSVENAIIPLSLVRPNKSDVSKSEPQLDNKVLAKKSSDENEEESSYSDRDDYYNFNSVSGSGSEQEEEDDDDNGTLESEDQSLKSKSSSKAAVDSQKKCMIVGRIFKNAKKNSDVSTENKGKEKTKIIPKQKLDEIFDNLRTNQAKSETISPREPEPKRKSTAEKSKSAAIETIPSKEEIEESKEDANKQRTNNKSRKPREVANLEAELGMSMDQIKELIGVGMRKTQRRCATNRQNKFMETWSSDEYEEFHSTKDVIALIQEAEMKAQRAKAKQSKQNADTNIATEPIESTKKPKIKIDENSPAKPKRTTFSGVKSDDSDFDEHWNKTAKRAKIRNRRRTIASREDATPINETSTAIRPKQKQNSPKPEEQIKIDKLDKDKREKRKELTVDATKPKSITHETKTKNVKPMPRRKRIASEMLYYWSSSSDDEFGRIEPSEMDDGETSENHLEQHGWIVGDSHKKLVTLLAHAKGKKIEDCGVKETVPKKK